MKIRILMAAVALLVLVAGSAVAAEAEELENVSGQVIQIRQSTATANEGALTEIRVRTRQRMELWLQLGPASQYGSMYQVGDRIRARVMVQNEGEVKMVQTIQNQRTRVKMQVRSKDGKLIKEQTRTREQERLRDGSGDQHRNQYRDHSQTHDRLHQRN